MLRPPIVDSVIPSQGILIAPKICGPMSTPATKYAVTAGRCSLEANLVSNSPDNKAIDNDNKIIDNLLLYKSISKLNEREKKIIMLRYFRDKTQKEVASVMGVSQVQISRIENKIIEKIKSEIM